MAKVTITIEDIPYDNKYHAIQMSMSTEKDGCEDEEGFSPAIGLAHKMMHEQKEKLEKAGAKVGSEEEFEAAKARKAESDIGQRLKDDLSEIFPGL